MIVVSCGAPTEGVVLVREVNCYYCQSALVEPYAEENGYALVRCLGCGLLYVRMRPDASEITQAAKTGQHGGSKVLDVTGRFSSRKVVGYSRILSDIYGQGGAVNGGWRWLDIGCGHGEFVLALQQYFGSSIQVRGVEPNIHKQRSARSRGLDVTYFDLDSHGETYDRVSLLNVFSHLPDPPEILRQWTKLLAPNGELLLETGDTAGLPSSHHYRP